jgi:hypothetical protein
VSPQTLTARPEGVGGKAGKWLLCGPRKTGQHSQWPGAPLRGDEHKQAFLDGTGHGQRMEGGSKRDGRGIAAAEDMDGFQCWLEACLRGVWGVLPGL